MGILGIFLRGVVTGMVGLGAISWLIASRDDEQKALQSEADYADEEE